MAIAKEGDFTTEFVIGIRVECVEQTRCRARQNVLRQAGQENALEVLDAILSEARHMKLKICPNTTVGCFLARRLPIKYSFDARLAIAQDRAAGMPRGLLASCQEPFVIFCGDQNPCVKASKGFCIGIIDPLLPARGLPWLIGR